MWEIDGNDITDKKCKLAANKRGLKKFGTERRLRDLKGKHFDLVIVGSVAVCPKTGARLGQGTGFDDLEWGILSELGIVDDKTVVATTVHDNQVLDMLPPYIFQNHDVPVDIICTPAQTIRIRNRRVRPTGLNWNSLTPSFLDIPVIRDLRRLQRQQNRHFEITRNRINGMDQSNQSAESSSSGVSEDMSHDLGCNLTNQNPPMQQPMINGLTIDSICKSMNELTKVN